MRPSQLKVLQQFPTAQAIASPDGRRWQLDGIYGVFEVQADEEAQLWDAALKFIKKNPDAQERYLIRVEYGEQFGKVAP